MSPKSCVGKYQNELKTIDYKSVKFQSVYSKTQLIRDNTNTSIYTMLISKPFMVVHTNRCGEREIIVRGMWVSVLWLLKYNL